MLRCPRCRFAFGGEPCGSVSWWLSRPGFWNGIRTRYISIRGRLLCRLSYPKGEIQGNRTQQRCRCRQENFISSSPHAAAYATRNSNHSRHRAPAGSKPLEPVSASCFLFDVSSIAASVPDRVSAGAANRKPLIYLMTFLVCSRLLVPRVNQFTIKLACKHAK